MTFGKKTVRIKVKNLKIEYTTPTSVAKTTKVIKNIFIGQSFSTNSLIAVVDRLTREFKRSFVRIDRTMRWNEP